jgi:hypothetical protein
MYVESQNTIAFPNPFWQGCQIDLDYTGTGNAFNTQFLFMGWVDAGGVQRLWLRNANLQPTGGLIQMQLCKTNAAGTTTQLGSNFGLQYNNNSHVTSKLDFNINYGASGTVTIYQNGVSMFTFSGDTTTDSVTSLSGCYIKCGCPVQAGLTLNAILSWSEFIVADVDTRSMSLQTLQPVANGNTHNFDTGTPAAANVNETTLNDATLDGSSSAGQIDQYTIGSLVSGATIIAVGISARMAKGSSGPSKMDLGFRISGADYWSSDISLNLAWTCQQNWWLTDPSTSASWAALPTNIGLKSVT